MRKFDDPNLRFEHASGRAIADVYTEELHQLYLAVWERAKYRLEKLPAEFFRDIGRRFADQASMTLVRCKERPVAFVFGIWEGSAYHNLYCGLDYELNDRIDLYFNLYYHELDRLMRAGARLVHMGQTSDEFKARLGATPEPLWFAVRATNPLVHRGLRTFSKWIFPPVLKTPQRQVFRIGPAPRKTKALREPASTP